MPAPLDSSSLYTMFAYGPQLWLYFTSIRSQVAEIRLTGENETDMIFAVVFLSAIACTLKLRYGNEWKIKFLNFDCERERRMMWSSDALFIDCLFRWDAIKSWQPRNGILPHTDTRKREWARCARRFLRTYYLKYMNKLLICDRGQWEYVWERASERENDSSSSIRICRAYVPKYPFTTKKKNPN